MTLTTEMLNRLMSLGFSREEIVAKEEEPLRLCAWSGCDELVQRPRSRYCCLRCQNYAWRSR